MRSKKVKRYKSIYRKDRNSRFTVLSVLAGVVLVAALAFVGYSIYDPIYNFVTGVSQSSSEAPPPSQSSEAEPASSSVPEPTPEPQPVAAETHAAYLPHTVVADLAKLDAALEVLKGTGVNQVLFDAKDTDGKVLFLPTDRTGVPSTALAPNAVDLKATVQRIQNAGFEPIARLTAFKDNLAPREITDAAVHYQDSEWLWLDNSKEKGGKAWLNPYSEQAVNYLNLLTGELGASGVKLVLLDRVQFPQGVALKMSSYGPNSGDKNKQQALQAYLNGAQTQLKELGSEGLMMMTAAEILSEAQPYYFDNPVMIAGGKGAKMAVSLNAEQFGKQFSYKGTEIVGADAAATIANALQAIRTDFDPNMVVLLAVDGLNREQLDAQIAVLNQNGVREYILYAVSGAYPPA